MACYHPIQGYKGPDGGFQFTPRTDLLMTVPCGQCIGCKLERSRQWAVRIMHEVQMHSENSFVTLTYDKEHLPGRGMLCLTDWQLFMKRLRKFYGTERISFFHCGEYGEVCDVCRKSKPVCRCGKWSPTLGRPHYHAVLFGVHFPDQRLYERNERGDSLYESPTLTRLWGNGQCLIGAVTFESAAYVARYCCSKITGDRAAKHYRRVDRETGEVYFLPPEYATMSLRPAIGRSWFEKYSAEVVSSDSVVMRGVEMRGPRYYDKLRDSSELKEVKKKRKKGILKHNRDLTGARMKDRERVKLAQVTMLKRKL